MARFTLKGDQRRVDLEQPIDEAPSPPVAPAPPSATPPEEAPPLIDTPSPSTAPTFSGLGTTFNNAIQAPVSSLPQTPVDQGTQGTGSVNNFANELTAVHNGVLAEVSKGQLSGAALGHVQAILSDINTAISTANATANSAIAAGNTAAAEQSLRASNLEIVNTVNAVKTDVALTNLALASAPGTPTAPDAPHANLAEIGVIFNDAADKILGGVNDANRAEITDDINAVIKDMEALISANPQLFEGATGEHADAVVRQLQLELTYINDPNISPDAARASIDNILDIIDIVQSDPNLADMATQGGVSGFSPLPDAANPGPAHLENDVQTVFTAGFIAQSNSLGQQAIDLVGSGDTKAIAALIADLKAFEKFVADFDAAQGGNALLDATGALGAEVAAMIKGLQIRRRHPGHGGCGPDARQRGRCRRRQRLRHRKPLQYRWRDCRRSPGDGAGGRNAGHRPRSRTGPGTRCGPRHQRRAGHRRDVRRHHRGRGPCEFGHARSGASSTPHVGIAARGAASDVPDAPGMPEADTSSQERVRRSGSRNGRREEAFARMRPQGTMAPDDGFGSIIPATSAVGGIGAVAVRQVK